MLVQSDLQLTQDTTEQLRVMGLAQESNHVSLADLAFELITFWSKAAIFHHLQWELIKYANSFHTSEQDALIGCGAVNHKMEGRLLYNHAFATE